MIHHDTSAKPFIQVNCIGWQVNTLLSASSLQLPQYDPNALYTLKNMQNNRPRLRWVSGTGAKYIKIEQIWRHGFHFPSHSVINYKWKPPYDLQLTTTCAHLLWETNQAAHRLHMSLIWLQWPVCSWQRLEQLHASARQSWRGCTTHLWHVPQTVCIQMMLNGLHIRPKNILERVEPVGHETPVEVDQTCKSVIHHVTPWIMPALQRCKVWIQDPRLIDSRFKTLSRVAGVGFHPTNIYKNN